MSYKWYNKSREYEYGYYDVNKKKYFNEDSTSPELTNKEIIVVFKIILQTEGESVNLQPIVFLSGKDSIIKVSEMYLNKFFQFGIEILGFAYFLIFFTIWLQRKKERIYLYLALYSIFVFTYKILSIYFNLYGLENSLSSVIISILLFNSIYYFYSKSVCLVVDTGRMKLNKYILSSFFVSLIAAIIVVLSFFPLKKDQDFVDVKFNQILMDWILDPDFNKTNARDCKYSYEGRIDIIELCEQKAGKNLESYLIDFMNLKKKSEELTEFKYSIENIFFKDKESSLFRIESFQKFYFQLNPAPICPNVADSPKIGLLKLRNSMIPCGDKSYPWILVSLPSITAVA
jgi:hypothetical protein